MIYLASPYSDPDPLIRKARYEAACDRTTRMLQDGALVYSPIAHSHALAERGLPGDWFFWADHNRAMLKRCDALVVLTLPGWERSEGVRAEIEIARTLPIAVRYEPAAHAAAEAS